ncbi:NAD-dependent epimerase/dehydratase family protein [Candidatus Nomurabacteria bacterium]|nr:NAD-dependent epimerase/dehydratase family protein [Candidatus Nomurabacteria bacterium]
MNKKTFLITGGAGFIGTNLAIHLTEVGHKVVVVDDLSAGDHTARLPEAVDFHKLDIRDTAGLTRVCAGVDVIVHLAALPRVQFSIEHPLETHDVNINGTLSVLEAARHAGVPRIVYAASSSAYGDQETLPLSLDLPPQPKSPYALQKFVGEEMMRTWSVVYGLKTVSLRFFNVYGPHMDPDGAYALVIGRFLKLVKAGQPLTITGDGQQTRDFTHVKDVIKAIVNAGTLETVGQGEVFNVGAGVQTSINEIAKLVGGEVEYVPARLEPKHTMADITQTKARLQWEPSITVAEGVAELKQEAGLI